MKWTVLVLALVAIGVRSASIETAETVVSNIQTDDVPANILKSEPVLSNVQTEDVPASIVKPETAISEDLSANIDNAETVVKTVETEDLSANIVKPETVVKNVETEVAPVNTEVAPANIEVAPVNTEVAPANTEVAPANTEVAAGKTETVISKIDTDELAAKIAKLDQILLKAEKFQHAFDKTEEFLQNAMHVQEIIERTSNLAAWNPHWEEYEHDYYDRNYDPNFRHYSDPRSVNLFAEIPSHASPLQHEFSGENHVQEHSGETFDHLDAETMHEISEYIDSVIQEKLSQKK